MAVAVRRVSVGPTAVLLADYSNTLPGGGQVTLTNSDASFAVLIGDSTVTAATGYPLKAGVSLSILLTQPDAIYGITGGTTNTVIVNVIRAGG